MKELTVKQDEQKPIPTEVLAASIKSIAEGMKKLRSTPLNDKALYLLIQNACSNEFGSTYQGRKPSIKEVRAVLDGIESLESEYLRKPAKK